MIPPSVQALVDIFGRELADLRFGDLNSKDLAHLVTEVEAATDAVTAAQSALDAARAKLLERQESMLLQAQRALAYARIYAESNDALRTQLEEIALPRPAKRAKAEAVMVEGPASAVVDGAEAEKPRRGRPRRKVEAEDAANAAE